GIARAARTAARTAVGVVRAGVDARSCAQHGGHGTGIRYTRPSHAEATGGTRDATGTAVQTVGLHVHATSTAQAARVGTGTSSAQGLSRGTLGDARAQDAHTARAAP